MLKAECLYVIVIFIGLSIILARPVTGIPISWNWSYMNKLKRDSTHAQLHEHIYDDTMAMKSGLQSRPTIQSSSAHSGTLEQVDKSLPTYYIPMPTHYSEEGADHLMHYRNLMKYQYILHDLFGNDHDLAETVKAKISAILNKIETLASAENWTVPTVPDTNVISRHINSSNKPAVQNLVFRKLSDYVTGLLNAHGTFTRHHFNHHP